MKDRFLFAVWMILVLAGISLAGWSQPHHNSEAGSAPSAKLRHPGLVERFYAQRENRLFWFGRGEQSDDLRTALGDYFKEADSLGLVSAAYLAPVKGFIVDAPEEPGQVLADRLLTDAAISFSKDLYAGAAMARWVSYDGISYQYADTDNDHLLRGLQSAESSERLIAFFKSLEPECEAYTTLREALKNCLQNGDNRTVLQLTTSMNYYRWFRHFQFDSFVVINIASAKLDYYRGDSIVLSMNAVLGKPETRTPRFAAYVKEVTLYPYWNMPRSILLNEWLPSFRKNPALISFLGMEILDRRGKIVNPMSIDWARVSSTNFPYRIREKPGCQNPMGVIKFSLTSPYDVYLHDTNFKGAFLSSTRYYSHGCIRVAQPMELADALLINRVDTGFLKACYRDQVPQVITLPNPVPVFVVYMCAEAGAGGVVRYFRDIYRLLK